jgi:hypothetical protein
MAQLRLLDLAKFHHVLADFLNVLFSLMVGRQLVTSKLGPNFTLIRSRCLVWWRVDSQVFFSGECDKYII